MNLKKIGVSEITFFLVCISPFLAYLKSDLISSYIPMALESGYIAFQIYKHKGKIKPILLLFMLWLVIITLLNYSGNITSVNRMIGELISLLTVLTISQDTKGYKFVTIYRMIAMVCLIYFIAQVLLMYTFSYPLQFTIPFLPVKEELEFPFRIMSYYNRSSLYIRFPGPFSEPSHYAAYLMPLLIMALFDNKKQLKDKWRLPVCISATMVMSTSGLGILLCAVTWGLYFILDYSTTKNRLALFPAMLLAILVLFTLLMMYSEQFYITVSNLFFVTDTNRFSDGSKADYRIYRGFSMYFQLPFLNKLFGVGYANMNDFALTHGINTIYDIQTSGSVEYYNGISQILLYSGCFGFILWTRGMIGYIKGMSKVGKILFIIYVFYIIGSGTLFGTFSSIFLACATLLGKEKCASNKIAIKV